MAAEVVCTSYTKRTVEINFTGDSICCARCPLLETYARKQCRLTGEYLADGYLIGGPCPMNLIEEEEYGGSEYEAI